MTASYDYVHVYEDSQRYNFHAPNAHQSFTGPSRLQDMLTWAGRQGWRLRACNADLTAFIFEREGPWS